MIKHEKGDWTEYRKLPDLMEIDFHRSGSWHQASYNESMYAIGDEVLEALKRAQEEGKKFLLITHGWSTSRNGKTTSRSVVRGLMRSKDATPFIIRSRSIQHESVFVAAIRPKPSSLSAKAIA